MTDSFHVARLVTDFIRGNADPSELSGIGVTLRVSDEGCTIDEPAGLPITEPSVEDVATGLYVQWVRSTELRDWARVLLGANFIDLRALEDDPHGEALLELVWATSANEQISDGDLDLLRSLADLS